MGVIWYIAWVLIVTESPATYGNISQQELEYIQQSIGFTETQAKVTYNDEMWMLIKYCYAPGCLHLQMRITQHDIQIVKVS